MKTLNPTTVELHVSACSLDRKHLRHIKEAGGSFSHVRGFVDKRYVELPIEAVDTIDEVIRVNREFYAVIEVQRPSTVVFRFATHHALPAWVTVHYTSVSLSRAIKKFEAAYAKWERRSAKVSA